MTASFAGNVAVGVRSTVAITQGPNSFYYFEAQRSSMENVYVGVSGTADIAAPPASATGDSYIANFKRVNTVAVSPSTNYGGLIGSEDVLGFAVDYRSKFPVVYVIGSAATSGTDCMGLSGDVPCVYGRAQLKDATGSLYIYAYSGTDPSIQPEITINTGADLVNKPFVYAEAGVRNAIRKVFYEGDRGFNMQWPSETGPGSVPTLTRRGSDWAVVRMGDSTPARDSLAVYACPSAAKAAVSWKDDSGIERGTGESLSLTDQLITALGAGTHTLFASVVDPTTHRYNEMRFRLTIEPEAADPDNDGDGWTYSQEKAGGTDPALADTDGDGLSDAVEVTFGFDPTRADTDGDGVHDGHQRAGTTTLPERVTLVKEAGATPTSVGIVLSEDQMSAAFTSDLNQDCTQNRAPYTDPAYTNEACRKRAVRANFGVQPGEFRYFETRRLSPDTLDLVYMNVGHGAISATGQIEPYCCFDASTPSPLTPPSFAINSQGGFFVRLSLPVADQLTGEGYRPANTIYYGIAIDYTGSDPIAYIVSTDIEHEMNVVRTVLSGPNSFGGADIMPMLYGHPVSDSQAAAAVNFGLQAFHYDIATLRSLLPNGSNLKPGIGIHERP